MALYVPRLTFALAEQADIPAVFGAIHRRYRTPHVSILLFIVLVWLLAVLGSFRWNVMLSAVARLFSYGGVCAAVPMLRRKDPQGAQFRLPAGVLIPVLGVAFSLVLVSRMGRGDLVLIVATCAVALLNWLWARRRVQRLGSSASC
jgi:amino acid transporter